MAHLLSRALALGILSVPGGAYVVTEVGKPKPGYNVGFEGMTEWLARFEDPDISCEPETCPHISPFDDDPALLQIFKDLFDALVGKRIFIAGDSLIRNLVGALRCGFTQAGYYSMGPGKWYKRFEWTETNGTCPVDITNVTVVSATNEDNKYTQAILRRYDYGRKEGMGAQPEASACNTPPAGKGPDAPRPSCDVRRCPVTAGPCRPWGLPPSARQRYPSQRYPLYTYGGEQKDDTLVIEYMKYYRPGVNSPGMLDVPFETIKQDIGRFDAVLVQLGHSDFLGNATLSAQIAKDMIQEIRAVTSVPFALIGHPPQHWPSASGNYNGPFEDEPPPCSCDIKWSESGLYLTNAALAAVAEEEGIPFVNYFKSLVDKCDLHMAPGDCTHYKKSPGLHADAFKQILAAVAGLQPQSQLAGGGQTGLFNIVDSNHDGKVTRSEFDRALGGHVIRPGN